MNNLEILNKSLLKIINEFPDQSLGIAVSGGSDSVFLLHVASLLTKNITALYVNHHTRESCCQEAEFVQNISDQFGISCMILSAEGLSLQIPNFESKARSVRYQILETTAQNHCIPCILTAHNQNDVVETLFLKLLRGSPNFFIPPRRSLIRGSSIQLIRPMLHIPKSEILDYLDRYNILYCHDQSNDDPKYLRNFLRMNIIPILVQKIPHLVSKVTGLAVQSWEEESFLRNFTNSEITRIFSENECLLSLFLELDIVIQRRIIQEQCYRYFGNTLSRKQLDSIVLLLAENSSYSVIVYQDPRRSCRIIKEQGSLIFISEKSCLKLEKFYIISHNIIYSDLGSWIVHQKTGEGLLFSLEDNIWIRYCRQGDRINWGSGRKKISSFLKDKKIPKSQREFAAVVIKNEQIVGILVQDLVFIEYFHRASALDTGLYFSQKN